MDHKKIGLLTLSLGIFLLAYCYTSTLSVENPYETRWLKIDSGQYWGTIFEKTYSFTVPNCDLARLEIDIWSYPEATVFYVTLDSQQLTKYSHIPLQAQRTYTLTVHGEAPQWSSSKGTFNPTWSVNIGVELIYYLNTGTTPPPDLPTSPVPPTYTLPPGSVDLTPQKPEKELNTTVLFAGAGLVLVGLAIYWKGGKL